MWTACILALEFFYKTSFIQSIATDYVKDEQQTSTIMIIWTKTAHTQEIVTVNNFLFTLMTLWCHRNTIIIITIIINADLRLAADLCQDHPTWLSSHSTVLPDTLSSLHPIHAVCHRAYQPYNVTTANGIYKFQTVICTSISICISATYFTTTYNLEMLILLYQTSHNLLQ